MFPDDGTAQSLNNTVLLSITMEAVTVKFEEGFIQDIETTMKRHRYATKAEFIREAVRDKVRDLEKEEALAKIRTLYGTSKKMTTSKDYKKAKAKAFEELEKEIM